MNPYFYIKTHSKERVQQVCELAGTKSSWFSLCARGHGEFSLPMALSLAAASRVYAELDDDFMTVEDIFDLSKLESECYETLKQQLMDKLQAA